MNVKFIISATVYDMQVIDMYIGYADTQKQAESKAKKQIDRMSKKFGTSHTNWNTCYEQV